MRITQREIKHTAALPVGKCGHSPRHYYDGRGAGSHMLECARCGTGTGKLPTYNEALCVWAGDIAQSNVRLFGRLK